MEGNSHPRPRKPEGPKQGKPKVKHPKTHINQINEDQTQRENIKSSRGKASNNTQRDSHKLPKLNQEEIENLNRPISSTKIEAESEIFQQKTALDQMASQLNSTKNLEKS